MSLLARLRSRGLLAASTAPEGFEAAWQLSAARRPGAYLGLDPTADGLHVGNLAAVLALRHAQQAGMRAVALVGGATGLVGDPSGRDSERELLGREQVARNVAGLREDLAGLLDFGQGRAALVDNAEWFSGMSALELLRDVGRHFRVGTMLSRDSVRNRMERPGLGAGAGEGEGVSFTEFSYQLLQAYDFLHLYRTMDCRVQLGGTDQWGNIVGGIELIRRTLRATDAVGVTLPLLVNKAGQKFGKSAGNAVWLKPSKTSDYAFYQFLLRTEDQDVGALLLKLTEIDVADVEALLAAHAQQPHERRAQAALADAVTTLVRGERRTASARAVSAALFGGAAQMDQIAADDLLAIAAAGDAPMAEVPAADVLGRERVTDLAVRVGACKSKGEARRLQASNGLYLNNRRVDTPDALVEPWHSVEGRALLLRTGKKAYTVVKLV
jgi:tyrosyl-tRNA synthetase